MRRTVAVILCLVACGLTGHAQRKSHGRGDARGRQETVTVSGCVSVGAECMVLEPLAGGQKYSVAPDRRIAAGRAYRVTGRTSDVGFCMQGLPILSPQRVTPLRTRCRKSRD